MTAFFVLSSSFLAAACSVATATVVIIREYDNDDNENLKTVVIEKVVHCGASLHRSSLHIMTG